MNAYNPQEIEAKWQKHWEENDFYKAEDFSKKPKQYILIEFPYPSGEGLHVGHCRSYSALDAVARKKRMEGYNVLFPIGWDAFGLPAENYAIKTGTHPSESIKKNVANYKRQLKSLGLSFDWSREINTTDPKYYKWTQWIFLQLFKKGLAYQAEIPINWCPSCKIGLANEEVVSDKCERCGAQVTKKMMKQWMLKITAYADRLIEDLEKVDFSEKIKTQQINWIGKSFGTEVDFNVLDSKDVIKVFTTRIDTLFGVTAVVLAPENPLVAKLVKEENQKEVIKYIEDTKKKSDFEREKLEKEKTGVFTGSYCVNPVNNEKVPIWIGDYVVAIYAGGAVMMVPAHDFRDYDFAKKYGIKIVQTIVPIFETKEGGDRIREGIKIENRRNVLVIIKHWKEDKIYCLDWPKIGWKSFVVGGVEEGESYEEAAIREAKEESGYQNVKSIKKIGGEVHGRYFLPHKNVNRYGINECYYIELSDEKCTNLNVGETLNHKGSWIPINKVKSYINLDNNLYYWNIFENGEKAFVDYGILINSGEFNRLYSGEAIEKITKWLEKKKIGREVIQYKLRDWVFSRQHYWGEPIPIIYCEKCGAVPVPEKDLPVELPFVEKYQPTGTGESPLSKISEWVNAICPECKGLAKRETDTMPNWAGSNWYFVRYIDPQNDKKFADEKNLKYWMPVDWYNGGFEHTTLHLLYSRFWYKFLYDIKAVLQAEPYKRRTSHGIVLATDNRKMSKSFGNVVSPDDIVKEYGADTLRMYEMFIGPFDQAISWSAKGVKGCHRFLERVWVLALEVNREKTESESILTELNKLNKKIGEDLESTKFNTIISSFMEFVNLWADNQETVGKDTIKRFLILLAPFAPHITEELWQMLGEKDSIHKERWPEYDPKLIRDKNINLIVQINGKMRDSIEVEADISEDKAKELALNRENVKKWTEGKEIRKVIFVPGRIINIVI